MDATINKDLIILRREFGEEAYNVYDALTGVWGDEESHEEALYLAQESEGALIGVPLEDEEPEDTWARILNGLYKDVGVDYSADDFDDYVNSFAYANGKYYFF